MWYHELKDWPNFTWDMTALSCTLADIRHRQGRLLGRLEGLGFETKTEASLITLTNDVVKTSAIEGEYLDQKEVRSSIARMLGIEVAGLGPVSRDVEGIVEMTMDATQRYSEPLTKERLFDWHATMFQTGFSRKYMLTIGGWRTEASGKMQVVSGPYGREKVHFEAPDANRLEKEMKAFLDWFEQDLGIDPVIKAGIAHLWFVAIHPFEDGNGRIGRAICDMALARAERTKYRFYSLSSQIMAERKEYYRQLERQQRAQLDITGWLVWFLGCLKRAVVAADYTLDHVVFKAKLWQYINQEPVNERQRLVINRMLEEGFEGYMNTSKYAKLTKCSDDSALRDIQSLKERNILIQNPGNGRKTSYRLPDQIWKIAPWMGFETADA